MTRKATGRIAAACLAASLVIALHADGPQPPAGEKERTTVRQGVFNEKEKVEMMLEHAISLIESVVRERQYYGSKAGVTLEESLRNCRNALHQLRGEPLEEAKPQEQQPIDEHKVPMAGDTKIMTLPGGVSMEMVYVAPGSFQMGSSSGNEDETPHQVRLTKGYWIGKYPVTQAQWNALVYYGVSVSFVGDFPVAAFSRNGMYSDVVSGMDTSDFPMENIGWYDCKTLVNALNSVEREGRRWSLPTEAQWEFAARGGNKSRGYMYSGGNDMDSVGWHDANSGVQRLPKNASEYEDLIKNRCRPHSVKEKDIGNELGIVGMSGNVYEWCNDWYRKDYYAHSPMVDPQGPTSGNKRVLRGGSWVDKARECRSASRQGHVGDCIAVDPVRLPLFGLRLCCSAAPRE